MARKKGLPSPVRETFSDVRGEIYKLELAGAKVNLLFSRNMAVRSGDWHENRQFDLVLKGEVEVQYGLYDKSKIKVLRPGELFVIPPRCPHLFRFQKDTVMLEWWDGPFAAKYYRPYRQEVEKCLRRGGRFNQMANLSEFVRGDLPEEGS